MPGTGFVLYNLVYLPGRNKEYLMGLKRVGVEINDVFSFCFFHQFY